MPRCRSRWSRPARRSSSSRTGSICRSEHGHARERHVRGRGCPRPRRARGVAGSRRRRRRRPVQRPRRVVHGHRAAHRDARDQLHLRRTRPLHPPDAGRDRPGLALELDRRQHARHPRSRLLARGGIALGWAILNRLPFGIYLQALGGSESASWSAGVQGRSRHGSWPTSRPASAAASPASSSPA